MSFHLNLWCEMYLFLSLCLFVLISRAAPEASTCSRGHAKTTGGGACYADVAAFGRAGERATVPPSGQFTESHTRTAHCSAT